MNKICFYFLTVLFLNTIVISDLYKIKTISDNNSNRTLFVKKTSSNLLELLFHNLFFNEDTNQDNEDGEDTTETDGSPQEPLFFSLLFSPFATPVSVRKTNLVLLANSSPYLETIAPPPKHSL